MAKSTTIAAILVFGALLLTGLGAASIQTGAFILVLVVAAAMGRGYAR